MREMLERWRAWIAHRQELLKKMRQSGADVFVCDSVVAEIAAVEKCIHDVEELLGLHERNPAPAPAPDCPT